MDKEALFISKVANSFIGDDGALVDGFIYSADAFCEGSHFLREWLEPYQIAKKAMLVNISDAIAMNATPKYALITLSIPKEMPNSDLELLAKGFKDIALEFGIDIIGGDTVGSDTLNISITLISKATKPLFRRGLGEGDLIAYTGELGGVLRDLNTLLNGGEIEANSRFLEPTLRGEFIKEARDLIKCGMDISDGLFCDTNKLLDINNIGLELLIDIPNEIGLSGEEYEMLIGFSQDKEQELKALAKKFNLPLTVFAKAKSNSFRFLCHSHHF